MNVVKRFGKAVYRSTIKIPLTAGYPVSDGSQDEANGSLASVVTIVFVTAVNFAVIGIFGTKKDDEQATNHLWIMTLLLLFSALASVIFISVLAYKNRESWYKPSDLKRIAIYTNIKVSFLWLFGFACILHESLNVSLDITCLTSSDTTELSNPPVPELLSHFLQILCVCFQLSFITYFRYYRFEPSLCINYGILLILLSNLSQWFDSLMKEINHDYSENVTQIIHGSCFELSEIHNVTVRLESYIGPARVEFFLLSTGFILGMWPSIQENEAVETRDGWGSEFYDVSDEHTALLTHPPSTAYESENRHLGSCSRIHPVFHFCSIVYGVFVNMMLIIGNIVFLHFVGKTGASNGLKNAWYSIVLTFKLSIMIKIYMIYYHITWSNSQTFVKPKKLSSGHYLLIFSTSGTVALCTIGIIVGIQDAPQTFGYLFIMENIVDIIGTYLQTVLIIHAEKLVVRATGNSMCAVERLCLLLSIGNLSLWLIQSFFDVHYVAKFRAQYQEIIDKPTLTNIDKILSPILTFYRFHVSIDWYNLHRKFKFN